MNVPFSFESWVEYPLSEPSASVYDRIALAPVSGLAVVSAAAPLPPAPSVVLPEPGAQPRYVALCGAPKAGKTTAAEFLVNRYGAKLIDDGACLRSAAVDLFGGRWADYNTQEGKARTKTICGKVYDNRNLLGQLGNVLEAHFGDQFMPEAAMRQVFDRIHPDSTPFFVFPSVRKNQGITYRNAGGVVVEISRPGCEPVNDFDHYDKSLVNYSISNDADLPTLETRLMDLLERELGFQPAGTYP